jgi:hypothetical protein
MGVLGNRESFGKGSAKGTLQGTMFSDFGEKAG